MQPKSQEFFEKIFYNLTQILTKYNGMWYNAVWNEEHR